MERFRTIALPASLVCFAVACLFLIAGCGGQQSESTAESAETAESTPAEQAEAPAEQTEATTEQTETTQPTGIPPLEAGMEEKAVTTPSGLQYIDIVVGEGVSPEPGQSVEVHYTGWLKDGRKFDSSVDRGRSFSFPLGQGRVIKGWDEGVATMKIGGKRRLIIPSDLAYGPNGRPPTIPPAAELTFDVELLSIQ